MTGLRAEMLDACAAIVARDDPHLHATALFAPTSVRARLMVLYALDCELSRAVAASKESMIPRMRLQWWHDAIEEAGEGRPPKAHEVAGPLAHLIQQRALSSGLLQPLVSGYLAELSAPFDTATFDAWAEGRFGRRLQIASALLSDDRGPQVDHPHKIRHAGVALAVSFALRTARSLAAAGRLPLLPLQPGVDLRALAEGRVDGETGAQIQALIAEAKRGLHDLRADKTAYSRAAIPAYLPLVRAERVLNMASAPGFNLGQLDDVDRPFDGLRLAWRAARGTW